MTDTSRNLPHNLHRPGRAARSNASNRFEPYHRERLDDNWDLAEERQVARTTVQEEFARTILSRNTSPDVPFDRSINPYRGCEHGCIYCFARPTHAYLGYSPGLDFETRLVARPNAADLLAKELRNPRYRVAPIALGTNTDPYQPIEKRYRLMRKLLAVLDDHDHPVTITTKGSLIERDIDVLSELARRNLVHVGISITSLDARLSRTLEPRAPAPAKRLQMIEKLSKSGVPVRVMLAPVMPGLTDHEIETILAQSARAGARAASWIMLRLPLEVEALMQEWLNHHQPAKAHKVMARLREMHDGQTYRSDFGMRMRGQGPYAQMIAHRVALAMKSSGLDHDLPNLDCNAFQLPGRGHQLSLF